MSHRLPQLALVGSSQVRSSALLGLAEQVGETVARLGAVLVTGGRGGVMEAACRGALRAGGLTVGILPGTAFEQANPYCRLVLPTGLGHARNALTAIAGDAVVALAGAEGTLSELALAWVHGRPVLALVGHGGWSERLALAPPPGRVVHPFRDPAELECLLRALVPGLVEAP